MRIATPDHENVTKFIEAYRDSFGRGPGAVAELYAEPCVIAGTGGVRVNPTRDETERFLAEVDESHRTRGFTRGDILALDVQPLGVGGALATVRWAYLGACEELLGKAALSYNRENRRRPLRPLPLLVEEAVRHRERPAPGVPPRDVREGLERPHVLVHAPAPHDRIELRELDDLAVEPADHVDVARPGREVVASVNTVRLETIMVPAQQDDRLAKAGQLRAHERDRLIGRTIVIEEIAGDQHAIDVIGQRALDHLLEYAPLALPLRGLLFDIPVHVAVEMQVGGVEHAERSLQATLPSA